MRRILLSVGLAMLVQVTTWAQTRGQVPRPLRSARPRVPALHQPQRPAQRPVHWDQRTGEAHSTQASAVPSTTPATNSVQTAWGWQQSGPLIDLVGLRWLDPNPGEYRVAQAAPGPPSGYATPPPGAAEPAHGAQGFDPYAVGEPDCPPLYNGPIPYPGFDPDCPPGAPPKAIVPPPPQVAAPQGPPLPPPPPMMEELQRPLLPPNVIGGLLGTRTQLLSMQFDHAFHVRGTIIAGAPGSADAVLAFEQNGGFPNDFTSIPGTGRDVTLDGFADTFDMAEPLPPNEVPTSPGSGFSYDGGTVVYTNSTTETTAQNGQFQNNELWFAEYSFSKTVNIPAAGALSIRRMHVAENNSPVPHDRIFGDYRYFKSVPNLGDVSWVTLGLEKTFNSGRGSIDARLPTAYTLEGEQYEDEVGMRSLELGNVTFTLKHILWGTDRFLLTGGVGVSLPTGDDTRVFLANGTQILVIDNDAVHLQPFLATLWMPNEVFFLQTFIQADMDTQGNEVKGDLTGGRLSSIGEYRSASLLLADLSGGFWVYSNPSRNARLQAVSLVAELSYETTLEDTDVVSGNGLLLRDSRNRYDLFNGTLGTHAYFGRHLALTGGVALPISTGDQKEFDLTAMLIANWLF